MAQTSIAKLALALLASSASVHAGSNDWQPWGGVKCTTTVKSPQTIQSAINAAKAGDTICIAAGTYAEQLTITKNGLSLVGTKGATFVVPGSPTTNLCSQLVAGAQAGVCVAGADVVFGDCPFPEKCKVKSVGHPVKGVTISGLQISTFGLNIAVVGADNTEVSGNTLIDGGYYGTVSVGSTNTRTKNNVIKTSSTTSDLLAFIGICTDNFGGVETSGNQISGYDIALCVQTSGSVQEGNTITGCCAGAVVDPNVKNAVVRKNSIGPVDKRCAATFPINGGVMMFGSLNARVEENTINGQLTGKAPGIGILDGFSGEPASNNFVRANILSNNDVDIFIQTNGTNNKAVNNKCSTSVPMGLC